MRTLARAVGSSSPEVIEDACAFAWAAFLEQQPDRDRNWRGWLFRTAQRQAWRLERALRETEQLQPAALDEAEVEEVLSPVDVMEIRNDVNDALSILARLPLRLQRIALLRALGFRHEEIGQLTGYSTSRVHALVKHANRKVSEILVERSRSDESWPPRAERLWQLENRPPEWLVRKLGRPILVRGRVPSPSVRRLAWRRAALALDDYRQAAGPARFEAMTDERPSEPALRGLHAKAIRAVRAFEAERGCQRER
jgi:DNA-directed RNA polymerase specialized sigma24 family protein